MAVNALRQFNWRNFTICFLISMGNIAFGYPAGKLRRITFKMPR
jgi:hypothetical protein